MKITKVQLCKDSVIKDDWKKSFQLAKGFDKLYNKSEIEKISIAYECLVGKEQFYKMLNIDTKTIIEEAKKLLINYYKL